MRHYETNLVPLLRTLVELGGVAGLRAEGGMRESALRRASLRAWTVPAPGAAPDSSGRPATISQGRLVSSGKA